MIKSINLYKLAKVTTIIDIVFHTAVYFPFGGFVFLIELYGICKKKFAFYKLRIFILIIRVIWPILLLSITILQLIEEPKLPIE